MRARTIFSIAPALWVFAAAMLLLAGRPVQAAPGATDLQVYVAKVRALYAEAEVTSGFYDWRGLSRYRSHPGQHLGYDIALNAGRAVPAGWPGRVVGIIPWTDTEYGVCVEVAGGYRVTYGHLFPLVHEGDVIVPGQLVGTVARDHVDIKVRDASGGYLDWGVCYGVLDGTNPWVSGASAALLPPPPWMTGAGGASVPSGLGVEGLVERYRAQAIETAARTVERDRVRDTVALVTAYLEAESRGLPQAESQMLAWYRAADENKVSEAQVEAVRLTVKARRSQVTRLGYLIMGCQRELGEREAAWRAARDSAQATRAAALRAGASEDRLAGIDADARRIGQTRAKAAVNRELDARVKEAEGRLAWLRAHYPGGCSKPDLDEAESTLQRLRVALALWQIGKRTDVRDFVW